MPSEGALVVIGSGPGIGRSTASQFAKQGFKHIVLLSRDASRLSEDAKIVASTSSAVKVDTQQIDVGADEATVKETLAKVDATLKAAEVPLEVVLYNAARVGPSKIMEWEAKDLEQDLKVCAISICAITGSYVPRPYKKAAFLNQILLIVHFHVLRLL